MRYKWLAPIALLALSFLSTSAARAASEVVVSIRYLLPTGTSHAHLFLYREDGKLLRQLTRDNSGQDFNPIFSPDGATIVFTREKSKSVLEFWSIQPLGSGLKRLKNAPDWYKAAKSSPYFTNIDAVTAASDKPADTPRYTSSDGVIELTLQTLPNDPDAEIDGPGHGKNFLIKNMKTGEQKEAGNLPGFEGLYDLLHLRQNPEQRFWVESGRRLAFFGLHLNSTDGDTSYALDLSGPVAKWRIVRLSPNWAAPFPLPGEPAFLTLNSVRYVPIAGSKKTANSSYIERWDAGLHKIRFAHAGAAIAYGASMYRPGKTPAVVTIFREN